MIWGKKKKKKKKVSNKTKTNKQAPTPPTTNISTASRALHREYSLDVEYMRRVSVWEDTVEDFREVVTFQSGVLECPVEEVWYETDPEGGEFLVG